MFAKKRIRKPLYKQFVALRENVQNRKKLLKFKRQKWRQFLLSYEKKLKWYKKFKPQDHNKYLVSKFASKNTSYKKRHKNSLQSIKRFKLFYGCRTKSLLKKQVLEASQRKRLFNMSLLEMMENRLDIVLLRAKFSFSLQSARQLITHGKILVNQKIVKSSAYSLQTGDLISVRKDSSLLIESNIKQSDIWPIPPKHLLVNYRTMQILFGDHKNINLSLYFPFNLNLEQIINVKYL